MKAYGSKRTDGRESPDKGDINELGLSSKHGKLKSEGKRATRRYFKRKARQDAKDDIRKTTDSD
jgi:hypothetical protein